MTAADPYELSAAIYDRIYDFKDYGAEAAELVRLLTAEGVPHGARVLEAGIGTGNHALHLQRTYQVAGFDGAAPMLARARAKLPDLTLWQADLTSFAVDEPFDALLCLFSGIGYLLDEASLRRAASAMAAAVRPGGVLVVEPWLARDDVDVGRPTVHVHHGGDVEIARATVMEMEGEIAITPMHHLVARRGQPVQCFVEVHRLWCAPRDTLLRVFEDAGFHARYVDDGLTGRGLLVGRRRDA